MKTLNFKALLAVTAATVSTVVVAGQPAGAYSFTELNTDWRIVQDSFNDGTQGGIVGSLSNYEMFGMAAKIENGQAYFAFNSNLRRNGHNGIGQGDLFFNFTDDSFKDASAAAKLFAVHFAPNDAGNGSLEYGLYKDVTAKGVAGDNRGHNKLGGNNGYIDKVENKKSDTTPGVAEGSHGTVGFGDLTTAEALEYLTAFEGGHEDSNYSIQNVIETGTKVAGDGFSLLSDSELAGLDFGTNDSAIYPKANTFGFKFDVSKLPEGKALLSILHECINDGMLMAAKFGSNGGGIGIEVPEPNSIVSLGLIGLALAGSKLRKQNF